LLSKDAEAKSRDLGFKFASLPLAFGDLDGFAAAPLLNVRRPVEIG
jgi:hypothetical protein